MNIQYLSAIIILILDLTYYILTKNLYIGAIEKIQKTPFIFRPSGAIIRYFMIILGFNYFILMNNNSTIYDAFLFGIVFGGIFNGTMYASFSDWNWIGAVLDTLWLAILFSFTFYLVKYNK